MFSGLFEALNTLTINSFPQDTVTRQTNREIKIKGVIFLLLGAENGQGH